MRLIFLFAITALAVLIGGLDLAARLSDGGRGRISADGASSVVSILPIDWRPYRDRALLETALGDHEAAVRSFKEAIARNGGCASCWIGLAEAEASTGRDPAPSLEQAIRTGRSHTSVRTRAAILFARLGRDDEAAREFGAALAGKRDDKHDFFSLVHRLYTPEFVRTRIVPDTERLRYFAFVARHRSADETEELWQELKDQGNANDRSSAVRDLYIDAMVSHGRIDRAWDADPQTSTLAKGTVINADFESPNDDRRRQFFGWRISRGPGVRAEVVACDDCGAGERALRLRFDGEHDLDYSGVSQLLAVDRPGRVRVSARVRSDSLTSTSGPRLVVTGAGGCDVHVASSEIRLSRPWSDLTVDVDVPEACRGLRLTIRRRPAASDPRLIGGDFWLDDVRVEYVDSLVSG